jgi:signal transduction histidine kinase
VYVRSDGDQAKISIQDDGIGIPAEEQEAIFEKFKRGDQARARGIRGTGIGLAMVDDIVRGHDGRLEIESEVGQGSTFTIVLPLKDTRA